VNSVVTVVGMFAFLGTAYATSIRLSAIQGLSPMVTAVAFVLLQGFALVLMPVTAKVIHSYNPRWALGGGFLLIGAGDLWISQHSAADLSLTAIIAPLVLIGVGFAFALSGVTAVAVNTVPNHLAGMASGTTSQLRDFGFTLGPAVVGAIALSRAAADIQAKLSSTPALQSAVDHFAGSAPPEVVGAVKSGPLGANAIPGNPLKEVAFTALDHAYSVGYVVCGIAALVAAVLAAAALGGTAHRPLVTQESLED
jgi:Major Facilitator Superfamily